MNQSTLKNNYHVYILTCKDNTLYCGITTDLWRRLDQHNKGTASKYTRTRRPVEFKSSVGCMSKSEALKLEYKIKQQKKENKVDFMTKEWIRINSK